MPQTEYDFTLPVGYMDGDGTLHRDGTMRLATARDEIEPLRDARVRDNSAYLGVLQIARVITRLGNAGQVTPQVIEGLYAVDFDHLQRLYEQVNTVAPSASVATRQPAPAMQLAGAASPGLAQSDAPASDPAAAPDPAFAPGPPAGLSGISDTALKWLLDDNAVAPAAEHPWNEGMPLGLRQEQQRTRSREALMRAGVAPRRGRIDEGTPHGAPARLLRQRSAPSPADSPSPAAMVAPAGASEPAGASDPALMRLSSLPPADALLPANAEPAYAQVDRRAQTAQSSSPVLAERHQRAAAMDELCEELIARLRRELLVERERMGAPLGG
jgi:hypothetical protein